MRFAVHVTDGCDFLVQQVICLPNTQLDVQYVVQVYTHPNMAV